jgi:hypothetical protein
MNRLCMVAQSEPPPFRRTFGLDVAHRAAVNRRLSRRGQRREQPLILTGEEAVRQVTVKGKCKQATHLVKY